MHLFITAAKSKSDLTGVGLQMALELVHQKEERDLLTGLKTRTQPGRPDWKKVRRNSSNSLQLTFVGVRPFVSNSVVCCSCSRRSRLRSTDLCTSSTVGRQLWEAQCRNTVKKLGSTSAALFELPYGRAWHGKRTQRDQVNICQWKIRPVCTHLLFVRNTHRRFFVQKNMLGSCSHQFSGCLLSG